MYAAIQILEKALQDSYAMQASPAASSYCNQLLMAINLLKKHTAKMEQMIEAELKKESSETPTHPTL